MRNSYRLPGIKLSDDFFAPNGEIKDDIEVLRVGKFYMDENENYVEVTKDYLASMVKNFAENARGIDIMLDYKHDSDAEAAAWFKEVYLAEDGTVLRSKVDWTPPGREKVSNKEYRYISADFHPNYQDNESRKKFGPTLLGAGLTNRPVVKGMQPVVLSENTNNIGDNQMTEEEKKQFEDLKNKNKELTEKLAAKAKEGKEQKFSEVEAENKKLKEQIALAEKKSQEEKMLAEKKSDFDKMLSEGKAVEAQREAYMEDDFKKFAENAGSVNLSEKGSGIDPKSDLNKDSQTPAQDKVIELAEKMVKEEKVSFSEATRKVLSEDKELNEKYLKETQS